MIDVSIIIVNYNTKELTSNCINSVFSKSSGIDFEIILVDNASTDGSKYLFATDSRIVFVPLSENMGFGRANNEGFKRATGKYVLCLNPDTLLLNNAIGILCGFMNHHPEVGICGGNLYDADMNLTHSFRMTLPSFWWELDYHFGYFFSKLRWGKDLEYNTSDKPKSVGYITGADMMIRKDILDKTGGFSKQFFMYFEECELTYRIKKLGYNVFSVPDAKILHLEGKSFASSELTTKMKYQIYSQWMYRRLCFPSIFYRLLALQTQIKGLLSSEKSAILNYQIEVLAQIEKDVK
jgi:GT2 family glycosyltransferase